MYPTRHLTLPALKQRTGRAVALAVLAAAALTGTGAADALALPATPPAAGSTATADSSTTATVTVTGGTAADADALREGAAAPAAATLRDRIAAAARGQIGVVESSSACQKYLTGKGQTCRNTSWCAAFAEWTWRHAGVKSVPTTLLGRGVGKWGQEHHLFHTGSPKPGDLVVYGPPAYEQGGHVGVVVSVNRDGTLDTVEGNVSNKVAHRHIDPRTAKGGVKKWKISGYVTPPGA
ncbi:CHAP domain-containing protein [Kitasatospora sp. NPDC056273]|uniref:CHAP domain-containing protein n=1 Tax=Kitasatospora sp. NPDC056273 TaxID=3345769 RepID=UPI0035D72981